MTIEARGAEGGAIQGGTASAGKGAIVAARVSVTPGQALSVLVGQSLNGRAAGGGGTFVVAPGSSATVPTPLVIAGGGGGASFADSPSKHGQAGPSGGAGAGAGGGGAGGSNGSGGAGGGTGGNGGGGLLGDGGGDGGGKAFVNGGAGGSGATSGSFGGGASGSSSGGSGGGAGGYSGGGAGGSGVGGGGGSYYSPTASNPSVTTGTAGNSGNGLVTITYVLPTIRYVKQGGSGDGSSWSNASANLQAMIDAQGVQQVWVASGRYTRTGGGSFVMKNGVAIYGGFGGSETALDQRSPVNPVAGQVSSTTLTVGSSGGAVINNNGLNSTARLDGVVITGGSTEFGGGIYNLNSNPSFANCVITNNTASGFGGGIYNSNSSPSFTNCTIANNTANSGNGGGIFNERSSPTLTNCAITNNTAIIGGGIYNRSSSPRFTNCTIANNSTTNGGRGGGIYNQSSSPGFANCLLSGNSANLGGAMRNDNSSSPTLTGCTLTANRATFGAALINYSSSQPQLTNCILWDNQEAANTSINNDTGTGVTANYCLIGSGEADVTGTNNLTATVSPFVGGTDYRLRAGSPATDAGDPTSTTTTSGTTDLAGNPRFFQNGRIDIGAYEDQTPPQPIRYVKATASGTGDGSSWANASANLQAMIDAQGVQQVWVAGGRYTRTSGGASFVMKNNVAIYGGFAGSETALSQRPAVNPVAGQLSSTTLTSGSSSVINNNNNGLNGTAVLDGVVITGGRADQGGGIYNDSSSPSLSNCLISGNFATRFGGGLYNYSSSPSLSNCLISGNSATNFGGGLYNDSSSPSLSNCLINGNSASSRGGGLYNGYSSSPSLSNCLISGNSSNLGGALYSESNSRPSLVNCTLTANRAGAGAALVNYSSSQPQLTNCILWDNQEAAGTSINNDTSTGVTASYCLIGTGENDFTGSNNLVATSSPFVGGTNYQLSQCSVAVDAGDPTSTTTTSGTTDLAGNARFFQNGRIDIGAFEFQGDATQPLVITQQPPAGFVVPNGSTVRVSVGVSGSNPTVQWYKDNLNNPVTGQTSATLTITNAQTSDAGSYSAVITNACSSVTSTAFNLAVDPPITPRPTLTTPASGTTTTGQPTFSGTAPASSTVTVTVTDEGGTPLRTLSTTASTPSSGTLGSFSVSLPADQALASGSYSVFAQAQLPGQQTSSGSTRISFRVDARVASVTINPSSATLTCTSPAVSLTAVGSGSVRWSTGSTEPVISVSSAGIYSVTLTASNGSTASASTNVTAEQSAPSLTINPVSATLTCASPTASLTAVGSGTYRWSTGSTDQIISVSTAGVYSVTLTAPSGCTSSASVNVTAGQSAPSLTISPSSATLTCASPTASLTAVGSGTYRWSTGSTEPVISVSAAGIYSVTLTSPTGCTTSASASVTSEQSAPSLTINPGSATLTCASPTASLTAVGTGSVRWSTGSTEPVISVSSAGIYSVTLTAPNGCTTSASANVTADQTAPSLSITPSSATLTCASPTASLTAVGTGSVRWSTGSTDPVISVSSAGIYSVTLTAPSGCTTSASANVTADQTVAALSLTNDGPLACSPGSFVTLTATGAPAASTFRFSPGATQLSSANSATVSAAGTYSVTATTPNGCLATAATTVTGANCSFAISGVTTVSCVVVDATRGERRVSFTPQYTGLTGEPLSFSVVNELAATPSAGPYTLRLYSDNPIITLVAQQGSATTSFRYDWLAGCNGSTPPVDPLNTPPTVVSPITAQTATVGQGYSFTIPAGTFTDAQTPTQLRLSVAGLPAGLVFVAPATISGTPSVSGTSPVTVTATDPGGLSASTRFELTVRGSAVTPPAGFAISGVTTVSCETVDAGRGERRVRFVPQYTGLTGEPVSFSVVNELGRTMAAGPYTLRLYSDNPVITLVAQQGGSTTSFRYDWLAGCGSAQGRLGVLAESGLQVRVLGNPLVGDELVVDVSGASGQRLRLGVVDERGYPAAQVVEVASAGLVERVVLRVGGRAGVYLLQVQTPTQRQTVNVLKH
ncbi:hypothetical protein GCM10028817_32840 [Spirosoma pomorum]